MATSFTTHSANQVITSADINLIQTAVNALENAPPKPLPSYMRSATALATCDFTVPMTSTNLTGGSLLLSFFTAAASITTTQVRYNVVSAAASSGAGSGIGLFSIDASDNGTLIASVAGTTLFASTGAVTQSWAVSVALTAGSRYAVGFLNITSGSVPTLSAAVPNNAFAEQATLPRITGLRTAQSSVASFTNAQLTVSNPFFAAVIL